MSSSNHVRFVVISSLQTAERLREICHADVFVVKRVKFCHLAIYVFFQFEEVDLDNIISKCFYISTTDVVSDSYQCQHRFFPAPICGLPLWEYMHNFCSVKLHLGCTPFIKMTGGSLFPFHLLMQMSSREITVAAAIFKSRDKEEFFFDRIMANKCLDRIWMAVLFLMRFALAF